MHALRPYCIIVGVPFLGREAVLLEGLHQGHRRLVYLVGIGRVLMKLCFCSQDDHPTCLVQVTSQVQFPIECFLRALSPRV